MMVELVEPQNLRKSGNYSPDSRSAMCRFVLTLNFTMSCYDSSRNANVCLFNFGCRKNEVKVALSLYLFNSITISLVFYKFTPQKTPTNCQFRSAQLNTKLLQHQALKECTQSWQSNTSPLSLTLTFAV